MSAIEGIPTLPKVWFISGDDALLLRETPITVGGVPHTLMHLILPSYVKWRNQIQDEELDFKVSEFGAFVRSYPSAHVSRLSTNPEYSVYLVTCNIDGTEHMTHYMAGKNNEINRLNDLVSSLTGENKNLAKRLKAALQRSGRLGNKGGGLS